MSNMTVVSHAFCNYSGSHGNGMHHYMHYKCQTVRGECFDRTQSQCGKILNKLVVGAYAYY